jgi:NADPH-dependent curcumin reductase CurA
METTKEVRLLRRPTGIPNPSDFEIRESPLPPLDDGEVRLRSILLSVDPYLRPLIGKAEAIGQIVPGSGLAQIEESRAKGFREGDLVRHFGGLRDKMNMPVAGLTRFSRRPELSLTTQLHALGGIGLCAYGGLIGTGQLKAGHQVFVSAAAGAVGSLAVQIAKLKGCYVVGSASTPEKSDWIVRELGADRSISYRSQPVAESLKAAMPKGIDLYFDNVGGDHLDAALPLMNQFGRIAVCGMISSYADDKPGVKNLAEIIYRRVNIQGFGFTDFDELQVPFEREMSQWITSGQLKFFDTVLGGIERAPEALIGLFTGRNIGKMLIQVSNETV